MEVIDSDRKTALKRRKILRKKYSDYYISCGEDDDTRIDIKQIKGKWFDKLVLELYRSKICLYKKEYLDFAKEIATMFNVEVIVLCYLEVSDI